MVHPSMASPQLSSYGQAHHLCNYSSRHSTYLPVEAPPPPLMNHALLPMTEPPNIQPMSNSPQTLLSAPATQKNIKSGTKEEEVERQVCDMKKEIAHQDLPIFVVHLLGWLLCQKFSQPNLPKNSTILSLLPHWDAGCEGESNKNFQS